MPAPRSCDWRSRDANPAVLTFRSVALITALALTFLGSTAALDQEPRQIASLLVLLPWIAACTRACAPRGSALGAAHQPGASGGVLVLLYLLIYPTKAQDPVEATGGLRPPPSNGRVGPIPSG